MLDHYLCPSHRDWLIHHPDAAIQCWYQSVDAGLLYSSRGAMAQARSALGGSLEIAEILLRHCPCSHSDSVARYTLSILLFASICRDSGYRSILGEIANRGIQILRGSWKRPVIPRYLFHANWQLRQIAEDPTSIERLLDGRSFGALQQAGT